MLVCYTADELPGLGLDSPKPGSMEHGACGLLDRRSAAGFSLTSEKHITENNKNTRWGKETSPRPCLGITCVRVI